MRYHGFHDMFAYIMAHARPCHRQRAGRSVGTVVQLTGDDLDPVHGLVAVAAAKLEV
jgi:hypothetical protein